MARYIYEQTAAKNLSTIIRQQKQRERKITPESVQCVYCGYVNFSGDPCLKIGVCRQCGRSLCPLLPAEWPIAR